MNIDIASCYNFVYNEGNKEKISNLDRLSAMVYCSSLEDISFVLGSEILTMEEKSKLIDSVKKIFKDKAIKEAVKLEDSIEYRFKLVEEDALERGISQGKEETLTDTIKSMLKEKLSYNLISKITGKSLKQIKKIEESLKD